MHEARERDITADVRSEVPSPAPVLPGPPPVAPRRSARLALAAGLALLALCVGPFVALSFYAHPQNDDFLFATRTFEYGWVHANAMWFMSWTGRFTSTAIMSMSPVAFRSVPGYQWSAACIVTLLWLAAWAAVSAAAPRGTSRAGRFLLTSIAVALFLAGMPNLVQGLYFMAGAVTYQVGGALLLLVWAFAVRRGNSDARAPGGWITALAGVATFLTAGSNEIVALLSIAVLAYAVLALRARSGRIDRALAILLLVALAAGLFSLLAPGNRSRVATQERDLIGAVVGALQAAASFAWLWLSRTPLLPVAALLLPGFSSAAARAGRPALHPAVPAAAFVATCVASFIPPLYAGGLAVDGEVLMGALETRTVNVIYGFFLVGFFANLWCAATWYGRGRTFTWTRSAWAVLGVAAVLLAFVPNVSNLRAAWSDLVSGSAARYDEQQRARYAIIAACRTAVCVVPPIVHPGTLSMGDNAVDLRADGPNIRRYKQTSYAEYFRKEQIIVPTPEQQPLTSAPPPPSP